MQGNWNRSAQRVLAGAREEAARMRHAQLGTEHILLALCTLNDSNIPRILAEAGISEPRVREVVLRRRPPARERSAPDALPLTRDAHDVVEQAEAEARRLSFGEVGPEHLLLGITQTEESLAGRILGDLGVSLPDLWVEVISRVTESETKRRGTPTMGLVPGVKEKDAKLALEYVRRAMEIARGMRANAVGTEHLLLALATEEWGVPAMLMRDLGLDEGRIRGELARFAVPSRGDAQEGEIALAKHTRAAWKFAQEEAETLGHQTMRGEHLFLGLLRDERGFAASLLEALGLPLGEVRERMLGLMCPEPQGV